MTRRLEIALAASLLLHLAVLAWVGGLLRGRALPPDIPDTRPMIELQLIEQQGGDVPRAIAQQPTPASVPDTAPKPAPRTPRVPPTPRDTGTVEVPDAGAVTAPTPSDPVREPILAAPPEKAPLQMNLEGNDSESNARAVGVIPAEPDQRAPNRPPVYPAQAIRLGQQGAVVLLIHVSRDGAATGSDVLETSGYPSLDQAAQQAVRTWRFRPGLKDGHPVASDMPMRFSFEFN